MTKPRIRCYQWDEYSIWYKLWNGVVYRLDAIPFGEYKFKFELKKWEDLESHYVPWVGF